MSNYLETKKNALTQWAGQFSAKEQQGVFTWLIDHRHIADTCTCIADASNIDGDPALAKILDLHPAHLQNVLSYRPK